MYTPAGESSLRQSFPECDTNVTLCLKETCFTMRYTTLTDM